ncbi:uncharacterized protein LOC100906457 [Galendromus occidentalis]|uniref:Uncharacterized protein LOC100906457 n=1 Tax=Galendromus occidentalis TaxID=34638 RepID=A0AAJ7SH71_9ACAR|nr:uncharacterized protein LOC100906457 [Galendromus occidentalis]
MRLSPVICSLILAAGQFQDVASARRLHLRGVQVFGEVSEPTMSSESLSAVPSSHGFRQPVVLDCAYDLIDDGGNSSIRDIYPIVKWFRNDEPTPFYQWLAHTNSRTFHHSYIDFVDTIYKLNDVPHEMFRAIRITHPVKELSGNFSCEVIDEDEKGEEQFQELASHALYIYDTPSPFELRLNFSERQLSCNISTSEKVDSVRVDLYRVDYDALDVEVARIHFNATSLAVRAGSTTEWHSIQASVILQPEDTKVAEIGASRTFFCDVVFTRVGDPHKNESLVFQRSVRVVHEAPFSADYEDPEFLPKPEAWSLSSASSTGTKSEKLFIGILLFLYIIVSL